MSKLQLPPSGLALPRHVHQAVRAKTSITSDEFLTADQILAQIKAYLDSREGQRQIKPAGWRILVLVLTTPEETAGGVLLTDDERERRAVNSPQGIVLALGPRAYKATEPGDYRFGVPGEEEPWCSVGDRILFQRYGGRITRLANGQALAILNDTDISGTMDDGGWL